jgi:hypothetical protein
MNEEQKLVIKNEVIQIFNFPITKLFYVKGNRNNGRAGATTRRYGIG